MTDLHALPHRERVADMVHHHLRQAILDSGLAPGARLSVPAIAARLQVSRSPVREAVQRLVREGLAEEVPHRGASVVSLGSDEIGPLYEVREVMEGLAARLCAKRATAQDVKVLESVLADHGRAVAHGDIEAHVMLDLKFHALLRQLARNAELTELLDRVQGKVIIAMLSADRTRWPRRAVEEHVRLLQAIKAEDADAAERAARDHISRVRSDLLDAKDGER